jgi:hypothetical protein
MTHSETVWFQQLEEQMAAFYRAEARKRERRELLLSWLLGFAWIVVAAAIVTLARFSW